jgi:uncharacterized repeat protein (TIGR03847 family)
MNDVARRVFNFDAPDSFVPGTVGEPGDRTFYLQARKGETLVTVGVEKTQVAVLARRLGDLLDAVEVPEPSDSAEPGELEQPIVELFRIGAMALAWDAADSSVVIEAQTPTEDGEYVELADDVDDGPDLLRVRLEPEQARSFVSRAEALLVAGRPPCPFCGQPLDPQGHFCPRSNGQLN